MDLCPGSYDRENVEKFSEVSFLAFHKSTISSKSGKWEKKWNALEKLRRSYCDVLRRKFIEFEKVSIFGHDEILHELLKYCECSSLEELAKDEVKLQKYYYFRHEVVARVFHQYIGGGRAGVLSRTDIKLEKLGLHGKGSELMADFVVKNKGQKLVVAEIGVSSSHGQKYYNSKVEKLKDAFD